MQATSQTSYIPHHIDGENTIFFVSMHTSEPIHVIGQGFTKLIYKYVYTDSELHARQIAKAWSEGQNLEICNLDAIKSTQQEIRTFMFADMILNLPDVSLQLYYDARNYPQELRKSAEFIAI